jgi:c-di-GMP-binding flagellar brake protein YcgR
MRERRKNVRASLQTEVWLGQDGIYTRTSEILRDLSEGGAFIETLQRFAMGSIIYLRFKLPGSGQIISCTVEVRNVRKDASGFGVQFLDISAYSVQQIRVYIEGITSSADSREHRNCDRTRTHLDWRWAR